MQIDLQMDLRGATQYGSTFSVTDLSQDGFAPGLIFALDVRPRLKAAVPSPLRLAGLQPKRQTQACGLLLAA